MIETLTIDVGNNLDLYTKGIGRSWVENLLEGELVLQLGYNSLEPRYVLASY